MVSGRSVSRVKYLMGWGLPSSRMVKSFCSRLGTRVFFLSRTDVSTLTTSTSTLMVGRSSGIFCCWGGVCGVCARSTAPTVRTRNGRMPVQYGRIPAEYCFNMKEAIQHLRRNDPVLSEIIDRVGDYGIQFREPNFETLVRSIVYQQLSGRVASVIFGRLAKAAGGRLTPENILKMRPARMRTLGLSKQKTAYIRDLARHARDGRVIFEELAALED